MKDKIEKLLKELSDFSDAKVGDKVFSLINKESTIKKINDDAIDEYPINVNDNWYDKNGKFHSSYFFPTLFKRNPYEAVAELFSNNNGFEERWMMVSNNYEYWVKRKVFVFKNDKYLSWSSSETDEEVSETVSTTNWKYAKEIEEEKDIELTLEEIAEKFGVNVNNLKIKK